MLSKRQLPYDQDALPPSRRLNRRMGDMLANNDLSAKVVGSLMSSISSCAPAEFADVLRNPGSEKNISRKLHTRFKKKSAWMPDYIFPVRCWSPKLQKIVYENIPMQLPHEIVAVLKRYGIREKLLATDGLDPLTLKHLQECQRQADCVLMGIGLWGDGAPTQWDRSESIDVLAINFPGSHKTLRIPLIALPHSHTCAETWHDIFSVIKWSFTILASGQWPDCRHDGSPWNKSDACRKTPRALQQAALVEVRQDWKFAAEVFGFPAHNTKAGCCWACSCTPSEVGNHTSNT